MNTDQVVLTIERRATEREIQIVQMLADEKRPKEISEALKVNPRTMEAYIAESKKKFGCKSYVGLVSLFFRNKLIS